MKPFVLFGHNRLLGDLAEIIHANGHRLSRIVQNVPETPLPGGRTLADRLAQHAAVTRAAGHDAPPVEVLALADFTPRPEESYLFGFFNHHRIRLRDELQRRFGFSFATLVHPTAIVSPSALLGPGTIVGAGAIVASGAHLGEHVLVNRGASIGHDTVIGDFSLVQPGAHLASHIRCARAATIGLGASVIQDLSIGEFSQVAAGAAVTRDVPPYALVAGVPALVKKLLPPPA